MLATLALQKHSKINLKINYILHFLQYTINKTDITHIKLIATKFVLLHCVKQLIIKKKKKALC